MPINKIKKPITYEYAAKKNKITLDVKAPECPKKFVVSPNDCNLPRPGSSGLYVPKLIRINNPEPTNTKPKKTLIRNN